MDICGQLESPERNWNLEKMELLEQFDSERKEWEYQWKVMQKKIEEVHDFIIFLLKIYFRYKKPPAGAGVAQKYNEEENNALSKDHLVTGHCEKLEVCPDLKTPKKETGALNEALEEIAKISEELCSYQEEIRKKSYRSRTKSYPVLGGSEETQFSSLRPRMNHVPVMESQVPMKISQVQEYNNRKNSMVTTRSGANDKTSVEDRPPLLKSEVPPVPPRSTSWHMTSSFSLSPQAYNALVQNLSFSCETQECGTQQQHNSLHENEEFSLDDATAMVTASLAVKKDSDSERNASFCHNKWTCELAKYGESPKTGSSMLSVQKSPEDANVIAPDMVSQSHCPEHHNGLHCTDGLCGRLWNDSLGNSGYMLEQTQRNGILAAKTDEFNRIVFKTNKVNTISKDSPIPLTTSGSQNHLRSSLCGSSTNVEDPSNVCRVSSPGLSACEDLESSSPNKTIELSKQKKQMNGFHSTSGYHHMLHEHNWKPSNLSGRPRSADSRSNYGVVEKLLRNYERSTVTSFCSSKCCKDEQIREGSRFTDGNSDLLSQYLDMLQIEQVAPEYQRNSVMSVDRKVKQEPEKQMLPEMSVPLKFASGRGFSRPARPANQRLPSRWASRSPSAPQAARRTAHGHSRSLHSQRSRV
ncbi:LOW QUALITY PROTEIN: uncharacterized protein KIAA0408 homolog [Rhinatrema bivittatum]|uniref:LOW QUALITY PROTEIN: uncharacterized protein KIAA0408 homolog n=1 Tax=Rhinatrema bivittatum TaxID=194408 RepID=UPI00112893D0|nr:LOW QUALITY PROTEIN: uncharacterized protein KIAA0408 homolog [Rhinatrema bivittatum]